MVHLALALGDVAKVCAYVAVTTLPVIQVVLSTTKEPLQSDLLQPCNDFRCMYMRSYPQEHLPASIGFSKSGLVTVQNGGTWEGFLDMVDTSAWNSQLTCRGVRSTQDHCASYHMMKNIPNPMAHGLGRLELLGIVALKGFLDFLHDILLLLHRDAAADRAGLMSTTVAGVAAMIMFRWMAGIAQVVAMHDETHSCTCYYVRRDILVLCGFAVPLVYLAHFMRRCKNTLKALTYGPYLYFYNEHVPLRLLRANAAHRHIASVGGPLLVPELVADAAPTLEKMPEVSAHLDGWVPEWPSCREWPRTILQALASPCWRAFAFVCLPVILESWYLVNVVRKAVPDLKSDHSALRVCGVGASAVAQVVTMLALLVAASRRCTAEARVSIYLVWLQKWAVWMTQSPLIPLLYLRGIAFVGQFMGMDWHTTPDGGAAVSQLFGFGVLGAGMGYILHSYHEFHKDPKRCRPVLSSEGARPEVMFAKIPESSKIHESSPSSGENSQSSSPKRGLLCPC